jgi:hypothetical protein
MNTDTRLMILNDSDLKGCSECDEPFPDDFLTNENWYADIVWYGPNDGRAEVTCPDCLQGNTPCNTCGLRHPAFTCREGV